MTLLSVLTVLAAQAAVPPAVDQLTAACDAPTYATDMLVCDDPELRAIDAELRDRLRRADPSVVRGRPPLLESQAAWLRRRSRCAFHGAGCRCTADAYAERLAIIRLASAKPDRQSAKYLCSASDLRTSTGWFTRDGAFVIRDNGRLVGVAFRPSRGIWRPYAVLPGVDSAVVVEPIAGPVLTCVQVN